MTPGPFWVNRKRCSILKIDEEDWCGLGVCVGNSSKLMHCCAAKTLLEMIRLSGFISASPWWFTFIGSFPCRISYISFIFGFHQIEVVGTILYCPRILVRFMSDVVDLYKAHRTRPWQRNAITQRAGSRAGAQSSCSQCMIACESGMTCRVAASAKSYAPGGPIERVRVYLMDLFMDGCPSSCICLNMHSKQADTSMC